MNARTLKRQLQYKLPQMRLALIKEREGEEGAYIQHPEDIHPYAEPLKLMSEEHFVSFHMDAKHKVIGYHVVSHGTLSSSLVHPREVFKAALLANSHSLIVAHNHPSGSLEPSEEDLQTTRQLIEAGRLLGVEVVDHIIVSSRGIQSIREIFPKFW
jgi:DNA repair protein RadC